MPKKSLRCHVEIELHAITSPGTWLVEREDLYVTVRLFGQVRRTRYVSAIFPLVLHEKFKFDKVFHTAYEPAQVADSLDDMTVRVELIQMSTHFEDGRLLAWYEGSARDFLYPYPHYNMSYGTHDREILLDRTLSFPGISPRVEFSTKTVIQQTVSPQLEPYDVDDEVATYNSASTTRRSRSRTRTRSPSPSRLSGTYGRPTIASVSRSRSVSPTFYNRPRSVSPTLYTRTNEICLDDADTTNADDRPPFVVRKVQHNLIGRKPGTIIKRSLSADRKRYASATPTSYRSYTNGYAEKPDYDANYRPYKQRPYSSSVRPYSSYNNDYTDLDGDLLDSTYYRRLKAAALSPTYYRSSFRDYFDEQPRSPSYAEVIRERVRRALRRDRSLEEIERSRAYRPYTYNRAVTGYW